MSKLAGKVAVVTGASKGIGAGIARAFGAAGAAVVVNYASSREGAERVVRDIVAGGGRAIAVQGDVSRAADVTALFAAAKAEYGTVDVLVNNAGVYGFAPLEGIAEDEFHRQFNINVLGLLLATQAAAAQFPASGGSVINISSAVTSVNMPMTAVYTATKGAVDSITRVLSKELGPKGIRVNAINPGVIETEGYAAAGIGEGEMIQQIVAQTPLGRVGQTSDTSPVAVFLASDDARWVTGETMVVSGGVR